MKNKTLQEVYKNSSDEVKEIIKTKFSKEELGIGVDENQIREEILKLIKKNTKNVRFLNEDGNLSDLPTPRFEIYDENEEWLFDIDYSEENKHFWYSYDRIFLVFKKKCSINSVNFNKMLCALLEEDLKISEVTPHHRFLLKLSLLEEDLKISEVTPLYRRFQ